MKMNKSETAAEREIRRRVAWDMKAMTWIGLIAAAILVSAFTMWEIASNPAYSPEQPPASTMGQGSS